MLADHLHFEFHRFVANPRFMQQHLKYYIIQSSKSSYYIHLEWLS